MGGRVIFALSRGFITHTAGVVDFACSPSVAFMCDEVGFDKSLLAVTRHRPLRPLRLTVALPATGMVRASLLAPD